MKTFEEIKEFMKSKKFIIEDDKLRAIISNIQLGLTTLVVGPTGSGKTLFFQLLAECLNAKYHYQSLNGSMTIQDLTQERVLGKKGTFEEKDMVLAKWIRDSQKGLSFLQLDEINAAKPETLLAMHPIMDLKKELELIYSDETLKVTNNAILVMTCNEGDEYTGTNIMNWAFMNRPGVKVYFDYLKGDELSKHLMDKCNIPIKWANQIVTVWDKYMTSKNPEQPVVSIRVLEYWGMLAKQLNSLRKAGMWTFASLISQSEDEVVEVVNGDFFVHIVD
jgi:MoxR-like ATPase